MLPKLSIIIPCYNCSNTLREAVESCYVQGLALDEFEIVMVDDGSSDDTKTVMEKVASEHSNIQLLFHPQNSGGGAARNTGINASTGNVLYCLDSDNVFAPNSVRPMLEFLESEQVDGVAFYERRFFFGTNLKRYTTHINPGDGRTIELIDLFNETNTLLDNFFYTRASYDTTDGYPEHHGFDTQCYEMRYLSAGNTVKVVSNSIFFHRQGTNEPSYFERVHASGMFSVNFMLIYEDMFHLFTPEIQSELIAFPLFTNTKSYELNLLNLLKQKEQAGEMIFRSDYQSWLIPHSFTRWFETEYSKALTPSIAATIYQLQRQNYSEVGEELRGFISTTKTITPYLLFLSNRMLEGLAGTPYAQNVKRALARLPELQIQSHVSRGGKLGRWLRRSSFLRYVKQLVKN